MDIKVLLQALNGVWLIEPQFAESYALLIHQLLAGEKSSLTDEPEKIVKEFAWTVDAATGKQRIGTIADAVNEGVAVINMRGAIMKYDYCGAAGTQSMMQALQQANDNPAIIAVLLQIDSPGGAVDGTQQFANSIKNSSKPVVAYINGMMCSAAMWIGSAAQQRISSSTTDTIGSIGTMAKWMDFKSYYEKMGIKTHEVYATASTQKNLPFREAQGNNEDGKTNYEPLIKTWLDPTNEEFMGAIQENLPGVDKTVLSGAAYNSKEAQKKGLIDKIGSFSDAVNAAMKLGKKQQQTLNSNSMKWTKVLAFFGIASAATAADIKLEENHVDSLEALINERDTLKTEKETLAAEKTTLETKVATLEGQVTTLTTEKATLETKVTTLEKGDATKISSASGAKDVTLVVTEETEAIAMDFQKTLLDKI